MYKGVDNVMISVHGLGKLVMAWESILNIQQFLAAVITSHVSYQVDTQMNSG
jgi:hypothetical protein